MATDPTPTDAELLCLIEAHLGLKPRRDDTVIDPRTGRFTDAQRYRDFARAVLARWGAQPAPADSVLEDAARLDWLDQNIFHREMSQWDKTLGGWEGHNMWVMFAPKGAQGSARNILDAARKQGATHD